MPTLDDLIDSLIAFKQRYPAAGSAALTCHVDVLEIAYELGEVRVGEQEEEYVYASAERGEEPDDPPPSQSDDGADAD